MDGRRSPGACLLAGLVLVAALLVARDGGAASLTALLERERSALGALERLAQRLAQQQATIDDLTHRQQQARYALAEAERRQRALVERLAARRRHLGRRLRALYKLSRGTLVRLLLDADRGQEARREARAISRIVDRDLQELRTCREETRRLRQEERLVGAQQQRQQALSTRLAAEQQALARAQTEQREILDELRRSRKRRVKLAAELTARQRQLLREIAAFGGRDHVAQGFLAARGRLPRPVAGRVVVRFGEGRDPRTGLELARSGVTIRSAPRAAVRAVAPGTVRLARQLPGFGGAVLVDHGEGYYTLSAYLGALRVEEGREVQAGALLGLAGVDPLSGDPAVHFEIRQHQRALDPLPWLKD